MFQKIDLGTHNKAKGIWLGASLVRCCGHSHQELAPGKTQDMLEALCLGWPRNTLGFPRKGWPK